MHKFLLSFVVVVSLGASSVAMAAVTPPHVAATAAQAMTTTGKVLSVNTKLCTVTLSNKGVFVFAKKCDLSKITVGEKVTITWSKSGNLRESTKITAAK